MDDAARTTIGLLIYDRAPPLSLARLAADLDAALAGCGEGPRRMSWDHDDVAILDLGASRVALGLAAGPGGMGAAVAVSVGPAPGQAGGRLARRRDALARLIAERIADRYPPRERRWSEVAGAATAETLDALVEAALPMAEEPPELRRLLRRLDESLAARARVGRPGREPAPPLATPAPEAAPQAAPSGLGEVREALLAAREGMEEAPSKVRRLAAHTLDAATMVVALPVGAAMMTYSIGRGASLQASARAAALSGIALGAANAWGGVGALGAALGVA